MQAINSVNKVRLPPSSQRVLTLLKDGSPRTFKQVTEEIDISPRTVRYAIKKLKESGLIIEKFNFRDARQVLYQVKDVLTSEEAQKATA
ncbi:helix-turn-helix domain-containing protein [Methanogenium sp. S4BF]|uniref:winged helix-turn-helix domain-containing protein n=1 Tax=Methanogenium sp. S4BF TaxID=1789226 RepID=UPI002417D98B|nr:winged helix-turn-helix domain-containing protein [Methanogenium sp. S4BF]WFN34843.1 helix-turn-helix domain-containing protein [Methanogenium sp. S4BF]